MKIFGFAGFSGSGKTTLIVRLIPLLVAHGLRVSLIKHAHHSFDVDHPGKDSYRHRLAGASEVLVTSSRRWVLMHESRGAPEPELEELIRHVSPCDLLLVEGFKHAAIPKLEVFRKSVGESLLHPRDPHIVAVATDQTLEIQLPVLDLNRPEKVCEFVLRHLGLHLHPIGSGADPQQEAKQG